MGPKRKHLHSDCFSADVLSYRKKNLEMINNKKKLFMHINDIRRVLNGRADILKIRIMLQIVFMIFSFQFIPKGSSELIQMNVLIFVCFFFWCFFFNIYDQIQYYFASSINLININQFNFSLARKNICPYES